MIDQVLASSSDRALSFTTIVTVGLVLSAVFVAVFIGIAMLPSTKADRVDAERARLFVQSEAFWGRWPHNRLYEAPYAELAAEATRCARLIEIFQETLSYGKRPDPGAFRGMYDEAGRSLPAYQHLLNSVHTAMNYAISQGRGPQQPYGQLPSK
ncbi:hypothetical protein [Mycolicibacterium houstonense]|uniref:hypothetical protein n=1 Tax=Mycolicibacterium houstonense TaxID=146021 RepID=UPI003F9CCD86